MKFWIVSFLLLSSICFAQEKAQKPDVPDESKKVDTIIDQPIPEYQAQENTNLPNSGSLFRTFGSLLLVLGLIVGLAWGVKRWLPSSLKSGDGSDHFQLIQNFSVGPKKYLSLVDVDGKRFLLGITDQSITLLKSMDEFPYDDMVENFEGAKTVGEILEEEKGAPS